MFSLHTDSVEPPRGPGRGAVLAYSPLRPSAARAWRRREGPGVAPWPGGAQLELWVRGQPGRAGQGEKETPDVLA